MGSVLLEPQQTQWLGGRGVANGSGHTLHHGKLWSAKP